MRNIQINDKVIIKSSCNSKGQTGFVIDTYNVGTQKYVMVQLKNRKQGYNVLSVEKVESDELDNEDTIVDMDNPFGKAEENKGVNKSRDNFQNEMEKEKNGDKSSDEVEGVQAKAVKEVESEKLDNEEITVNMDKWMQINSSFETSREKALNDDYCKTEKFHQLELYQENLERTKKKILRKYQSLQGYQQNISKHT